MVLRRPLYARGFDLAIFFCTTPHKEPSVNHKLFSNGVGKDYLIKGLCQLPVCAQLPLKLYHQMVALEESGGHRIQPGWRHEGGRVLL